MGKGWVRPNLCPHGAYNLMKIWTPKTHVKKARGQDAGSDTGPRELVKREDTLGWKKGSTEEGGLDGSPERWPRGTQEHTTRALRKAAETERREETARSPTRHRNNWDLRPGPKTAAMGSSSIQRQRASTLWWISFRVSMHTYIPKAFERRNTSQG